MLQTSTLKRLFWFFGINVYLNISEKKQKKKKNVYLVVKYQKSIKFVSLHA